MILYFRELTNLYEKQHQEIVKRVNAERIKQIKKYRRKLKEELQDEEIVFGNENQENSNFDDSKQFEETKSFEDLSDSRF